MLNSPKSLIFFAAFLTFPQMVISHLGMYIKTINLFCNTALNTNFHLILRGQYITEDH